MTSAPHKQLPPFFHLGFSMDLGQSFSYMNHHHPPLLPPQTTFSFLFSPLQPSPRRQSKELLQMKQVFADTSFMLHLVKELVRLLTCPLLSCRATRIYKSYMTCLPFLLPLAGFFALVLGAQEGSEPESSTMGESKVKAKRRREEDGDGRLCGRDVEMVMERMGIGSSREGGRVSDAVGADDLNCLFEEKEPSLEEVKEAFCVFDRNGDGFIDAEELQRVLSILGFEEGSTVDACRRMIVAYDENGDGRIDFHEFVKFMECSFC